MKGNSPEGRSVTSPLDGQGPAPARWALSAAILGPHEAMRDMLLSSSTTVSIRSCARCDVFLAVLSMHLAAAEEVLYPALRRSLPDGRALTAALEGLARDLKRTMFLLQGSFYGDIYAVAAPRAQLWQEMALLLDTHVSAAQESVARLEEALTPEEQRALAAAFEAAAEHAPTRPHPYSPHSRVLGRLSRRVWSIADHAMDRMDNRIVPRRPPASTPARDSLWAHYLLGTPLVDLPSVHTVHPGSGLLEGAPTEVSASPGGSPLAAGGRRSRSRGWPRAVGHGGRVASLVRRGVGRML